MRCVPFDVSTDHGALIFAAKQMKVYVDSHINIFARIRVQNYSPQHLFA